LSLVLCLACGIMVLAMRGSGTAGPFVIEPIAREYKIKAAFLGILPAVWFIQFICRAVRNARAGDRLRAGQCAWCGYDLRATPGRCPECGEIPAEAKV
jgi:hypothetical protein